MAQEAPQNPDQFSVFVGDLAPDVDDAMLHHHFAQYYASTTGAKVMLDPQTQRSRGYGFVRFATEADRDRAIADMNGVYISTRPIRVSLATARRQLGGTQSSAGAGSAGGASTTSSTPGGAAPVAGASAGPGGDPADPHNTTLFIGGLSHAVTEPELHAAFARFGDIVYTKIPQGKGCGFVQFMSRAAAERAMGEMSGAVLGGMPIRISWGRSSGGTKGPGAGVPHAHPGMHMYGYYGGYPTDPYGYAAAGYPGMAYDPYSGAYAYHPADPYAAYGPAAYAMPGYAAMHAAAAAAAAAGNSANGAAAGTPGSAGAHQPMVYDPLAPANVDKMNMAYMHRHIPVLTGAFMRMPMPMAMAVPMAGHM